MVSVLLATCPLLATSPHCEAATERSGFPRAYFWEFPRGFVSSAPFGFPVIMPVGPSQRHLLDGKSGWSLSFGGRPSVAFQVKCHDFYGWFMSFPSKPLIRLVAVVSRCETPASCQAIPRAEVLAVALALTSGATPAAFHVHFISCKIAMETPLSRSAAAFLP